MPHLNERSVRCLDPSSTKSQAIDQDPLSGMERYALERSILAKIKKTPRFLLYELFEFFRGRADCFPSNAKLAEISGISQRNIQYLLRELETAELIKAVEDRSIPSQRRLVLLDHPHAIVVLKQLNALPEWLQKLVDRGVIGRAKVASRNPARDAKVAYQGTQNP